jgi:hypothetical protein
MGPTHILAPLVKLYGKREKGREGSMKASYFWGSEREMRALYPLGVK